VPDILEYSQIPADEKADAVLGTPKQRAIIMESRAPVQTAEELAADIRQIETYRHENRPLFANKPDRYTWILDQRAKGIKISEEDKIFKDEFEGKMTDAGRQYWNAYCEVVGIK